MRFLEQLRQLADSPVVHLVSLQRRRRARFGPQEMLKVICLFSLPILFLTLTAERTQLTAYLLVSALGLMVMLPLRQFSEEVALLAALRRGRCLEEIVSSGTSAQGLLDGLALQGLLQISRAALTVWPVFLLGTLALPPQWQHLAWNAALLWLPAVAGLFLTGYYLAQFLQLWSGHWLLRFLLLLFLMSPWLLAQYGGAGCLLASVLTALLARRLALRGLLKPARHVPLRQRNPLVKTWTQNPIARRELSRLAAGSWLRLALWRASTLLLPMAWVLSTQRPGYFDWEPVYIHGILLFSALFFVRAAWRTLPAVVREREQQTWEILLQTSLGTRSFILGWLQVCLYTVFFEALPALLAVGGQGLSIGWGLHGESPLRLLGALLVLPLSTLLGAFLGLALSASSRTTRQAMQRLLLWCLMIPAGWLLSLSLGQGLWDCLYHPNFCQAELTVLDCSQLLALLPVALVLALRTRSLLRKLPRIDPRERPEFATSTRYSPLVFCLDLASLLALHYGLVAWKELDGLADVSVSQGAAMLLIGALAWWLCARLPLATLAELSLGRKVSLVLGILYGVGLGRTGELAVEAADSDALAALTTNHAGLWAGGLLGFLLGGMAWRQTPLPDPRLRFLKQRLTRSLLAVLVGVAGAIGVWRAMPVPPSSPLIYHQMPRFSNYAKQLAVLHELPGTPEWSREMPLDEVQRAQLSRSDWGANRVKMAKSQENLPALRELREGLTEFGPAARAAVPVDTRSNYWANDTLIRLLLQSVSFESQGQLEAALNCYRWVLLTDEAVYSLYTQNPEWAYESLARLVGQNVAQASFPSLIEQLMDNESVKNQLRSVLISQLVQFRGRRGYPGPMSLFPQFYAEHELSAAELGTTRALRLVDRFDLWTLGQQTGNELLQDVPFCPVATHSLTSVSPNHAIVNLAKTWSRREGIAVLAALQLYRHDHGGNWPASLDAVTATMPRRPRCYLNADGHFDYSPGHLSCARANGSERIIFCPAQAQP